MLALQLIYFLTFSLKKKDFQILLQISYFIFFILTFFLWNSILFNDRIISFGCYFFTKLHVEIIMCWLFLTAPPVMCTSVLTINSCVALLMTAEVHLGLLALQE